MLENINQALIDQIWNKGKKIEGFSEDLFRKDVCGALMRKDKYGFKDDTYGWGIDMICPYKMGGDDDLINLRPMNSLNIESKANDYPCYFGKMTSIDNQNVHIMKQYRVSLKLEEELNKLYNVD